MLILSNNIMQNYPKHYPQKGVRVIYPDYVVMENGQLPSIPASTCSSLPAPPPVDTFLVSFLNETRYVCSRRACHEHCQSHYTRGPRLGGHPSVLCPLTVVWRLWLLWLWTWLAFPLASSRCNLWRWGSCCACEMGWNICCPGPRLCYRTRCDAPW